MPFFRRPGNRRKVKKLARKPAPKQSRITGVSIIPRFAALVRDAKRLSIPTTNLGEMYNLLIEHGKATPKQVLTAEIERLLYSGSEKNYHAAERKARRNLNFAGIKVD